MHAMADTVQIENSRVSWGAYANELEGIKGTTEVEQVHCSKSETHNAVSSLVDLS